MAVQQTQPEEITRLWEQVLHSVRGRVDSAQAFDTWFKPIVPLQISPQCVQLEVPNSLFLDWIHQHHLPALKQGLVEVFGYDPEVQLTPRVPDPLPLFRGLPATEAAPAAATAPPPPRPAVGLNPKNTFETFVVGSSTRFTHAACTAVAEKPGSAYNPLFIYGGSGLGKTHLLHAIGHSVLRSRPDTRVCYVPAERFTNEMIFAIQHAQTLAFRNKYRNVDLLLIDDIQFLARKESTQEEFFYTFNALRDAHRQIVVTADKPPKDLAMIEERLTSRFNQGLVTDVQQPDLETRIAILRNRCRTDGAGLRIADDILLLIADRISNNIRDLEGCLVRLIAYASLIHSEITMELAEEVLQQYVNAEPDRLSPERVLAVVCERYSVRPEALCGSRRTRNIAMPRQIAMYLLRHLTEMSLSEIGRFFGKRDHTTVLYACEKVAQMMAEDATFKDHVTGMFSTLSSG
jgi:chromosomal replication initiator protein